MASKHESKRFYQYQKWWTNDHTDVACNKPYVAVFHNKYTSNSIQKYGIRYSGFVDEMLLLRINLSLFDDICEQIEKEREPDSNGVPLREPI